MGKMRLIAYNTASTPCGHLFEKVITAEQIVARKMFGIQDHWGREMQRFVYAFFGAQAIYQSTISAPVVFDIRKRRIDQGTILEELTDLAGAVSKAKKNAQNLFRRSNNATGATTIKVGTECLSIADLLCKADTLIQNLETYLHRPTALDYNPSVLLV
jgi:hypothetical protein